MPLPIVNVLVTVQFEATAYVPVTDSVVITPSRDAASVAVYVAVVESNRNLAHAFARGAVAVCAAVQKPLDATQRGVGTSRPGSGTERKGGKNSH